MVVTRRYDIVDPERGALDRSVFGDEQTYQDELERIFGRAWLMLTHDSLIPNPNDFFLSYMGEDPVIITRDAKGGVHVFLNMCRHRGNRVVRADDGNAKNFMCTYHGWTFSNEGRLVSVPGLQEAYYGELDVERLGLVEARSDTYAGIIFATWAEDAPTLEAYLGDMRWYMDVVYNHRDVGLQAIGPIKWTAPFNWKTPVDNASDYYHAATTHISASIARAKIGRRAEGPRPDGQRGQGGSPNHHIFVNGHCTVARVREHDETNVMNDTRYKGRFTPAYRPIWESFHEGIFPEKERRLGSFRARRIEASARNVFPNVFIGLRIALPRGPHTSEIWSYTYYDKDTPPEIVEDRRIFFEQDDNMAGTTEQDDQDNWRQVTDSASSLAARRVPHDISMGAGHDTRHPELPGLVAGRFLSETNQRHYYARWQEFMNAQSWAEIHIDPVTARFEGTATMKG